jgi:hypothetical protein
MDPQKNVNPAAPAASDEEKDLNSQAGAPEQDVTNVSSADNATPQEAGADAGLGSEPVTPSTSPTAPTVTPDATDPLGAAAPTNPTTGDTPAEGPVDQPSIASETPVSDASSAPADVTGLTPDPSTPPVDAAPSPLPGNTDQPASFEQGVPATAPAAVPHGGDKKTVFVLLGVAVVLIAAIAALYLM